MEDIIYLINGRVEILEEVKNSEPDLKDYIIKSLKGFLKNEFFLEALPGHLLPDQASQGRRSIILERIKKIVAVASNWEGYAPVSIPSFLIQGFEMPFPEKAPAGKSFHILQSCRQRPGSSDLPSWFPKTPAA